MNVKRQGGFSLGSFVVFVSLVFLFSKREPDHPELSGLMLASSVVLIVDWVYLSAVRVGESVFLNEKEWAGSSLCRVALALGLPAALERAGPLGADSCRDGRNYCAGLLYWTSVRCRGPCHSLTS